MMLATVLTPLTLLALPILSSPSVPPDVIPEGWKGIRVETRFEFAPGARRLCLSYTVGAGDTLGAIAQRQCGSAARWKEIAALNPGVDPARMSIGTLLWLPPTEPLRAGELPALLFADTRWPGSHPQPLSMNVPPTRPPGGRLVVFVVPQPELAAFEAAAGSRRPAEAFAALVESRRIERLECEARGSTVRGGDPTVRRVDTYRFDTDPETGRPSVALTSSESYDEDGEPIDGDARAEQAERKKQALLLVVLGSLGVAGLVWARTRRTVPVTQPA